MRNKTGLRMDRTRVMRFEHSMSSLLEIEAAAEALSQKDKEELMRFLAMRIRGSRIPPQPRIYSDQELASMLAEDEADGLQLRQGT